MVCSKYFRRRLASFAKYLKCSQKDAILTAVRYSMVKSVETLAKCAASTSVVGGGLHRRFKPNAKFELVVSPREAREIDNLTDILTLRNRSETIRFVIFYCAARKVEVLADSYRVTAGDNLTTLHELLAKGETPVGVPVSLFIPREKFVEYLLTDEIIESPENKGEFTLAESQQIFIDEIRELAIQLIRARNGAMRPIFTSVESINHSLHDYGVMNHGLKKKLRIRIAKEMANIARTLKRPSSWGPS